MTSILTILPAATVKTMTENGRPSRMINLPVIAVDQGGAQLATAWRAGLLGHGLCAADDGWRPGRAEVGAQDNVGVEDLDEGVEVAGPRSRVEGANDLPLAR
jgi:hypothetical protein